MPQPAFITSPSVALSGTIHLVLRIPSLRLGPMLEAVKYHPPPPHPAADNAPRAPFTIYSTWSTPFPRRRKKKSKKYSGNGTSSFSLHPQGSHGCSPTTTRDKPPIFPSLQLHTELSGHHASTSYPPPVFQRCRMRHL
jgi:hypothetical protein